MSMKTKGNLFSCEAVQQRLQEQSEPGILLTVPEQTPLLVGDIRWYRVLTTESASGRTAMGHVAIAADGQVNRTGRVGVNRHGVLHLN